MGFGIFDELVYLDNQTLDEIKEFCEKIIEERNNQYELTKKEEDLVLMRKDE